MVAGHGHHEDLRREHAVERSSPRALGVLFGAIFGVVALLPLLGDGGVRWWSAVVSAVFLGLAGGAPALLRPINDAWLTFGELLHRLVSPVIIGLLYGLAVLPTGLLMRLLRKDLLRLRFDAQAESYWIPREPPGPAPDSLHNQF